jgi:uncharacterized ferritin-like protein (DUF455 family)
VTTADERLAPETIEAWALTYVLADDWAAKLAPPTPPERFAERAAPLRVARPGRGAGFDVKAHGEKSTGKSALRSAEKRAKLVHAFLHHELQAAELMAWAILAFPETPIAFRRGLLGILLDEIRHMGHYASYLRERGLAPGAFAVRDWFWERVPTVTSPAGFCATMGMGLEAANLDHAARFAIRFRSAGDLEAARIEELVHEEEIPHVRFGTHWFERFTASEAETPRFERWRDHLPPPLSPLVMRGAPLDRVGRARAGADDAFLAALEAASA